MATRLTNTALAAALGVPIADPDEDGVTHYIIYNAGEGQQLWKESSTVETTPIREWDGALPRMCVILDLEEQGTCRQVDMEWMCCKR